MNKEYKGIIFVVLTCLLYWIYLVFFSEMLIEMDAEGYQRLGILLQEKGWVGYLRTGPNREPLYPLIISASMSLGKIFHVNYHYFQKIIQVGFLAVTQLLAFRIMSFLSIRNSVKLLTIGYIGFSPALVNSAFSLYSEIATFPFVLMIILAGNMAFEAIRENSVGKTIRASLFTFIAFIGASFGKGIFQYVFLVYMLFFIVLSVFYFFRKKKYFASVIIHIFLSSILFFGTVIGYRYLNLKYNGNFEFTGRYANLLFGNAGKRTEEMSKKQFLAYIASVPGDGVCKKLFDDKTCWYTTFHYADDYWSRNLSAFLGEDSSINPSEKIVSIAIKTVQKNPAQYFILTFFEGFKMAFWESTQIGFVKYPFFLQKIFNSVFIRSGVRLGVSLLTYISMVYCLLFVWKKRYRLLLPNNDDSSENILFLMFLIIIPFTMLHSLFSILTRYALPIASLYVICIAFFINQMINKIKP